MDQYRLKKYISENPDAKLRDLVTKLLYDDIVELRITPGSKLNVNQIAASLGISRTPVAEAIGKLAEVGFVISRPGQSGNFVLDLSLPDMINLYRVRSAIECEAAALCAHSADDATVRELSMLADAFKDSVLQRDIRGMKDTDMPFHKMIIDACGNPYIIQSYNIGVASGGSAKTKVAASAGYLNQEGIVKKNQMERFTGRIRFDSDLSKRFTIGGTINFSHIVTKGAVTNAGANSYNGLVQSFVLYKPIFLSEDDDEASNPENYNLTNPITFINDSYKASTQNRTIGDLYLKYKILKNLTLRISGGGTILNSKTEEWYPSTTSWGYSKNGMAVVAESGAESWQTSNTLTYAISRGKHYLNAVLGFELRGYTATRLSTRAEGFENQSFNGAFDIGQGSVFPENVQTNRERNTSESEFLRLNYTLAEKYIFTASIRRDGSSKFGKNNKYGYFPSAAFAWSIGKEEFMKQQKIFSDMKLRLS